MGKPGYLRLPSGLPTQPSSLQSDGPRLSQNDTDCSRFWDLVSLSVQIPFMLPLQKDLVIQPFNGLPHRNLTNLNLHAWLLEPLPFRDRGSLMKLQQELKLLRDFQPEPYTKQSGSFLSNGVNQTRWTSGRPL